MCSSSAPPQPIRGAEYVRMSTDGQQYSIANQQAAIREYAAPRGIDIVKTYADPGKSGLRLANRPGLRQLLADVEARRADFEMILVYDVSRWGRFQDTDESGYYEFLCRRANIRVEYCAEPFENTDAPITAVYKSIKRSMAAEYSREQSARVTRALHRTARLGHHAGGIPGYGYRRMLVGPDGKHKGILEKGIIRAVRLDYMTLVPGPAEEVHTVRRIFRLYARQGWTPSRIASQLNKEGRRNSVGASWRPQEISLILKNERYAGTLVYNKTSAKLRVREKRNPREEWIRVPNAFQGLISHELFEAAQNVAAARRHQVHTKESLCARLRTLLQKYGYISQNVLREHPHPTAHAFYLHFGSLRNAYREIGYTENRRGQHLDVPGLEARDAVERAVSLRICEALRDIAVAPRYTRWHRVVAVGEGHRIAVRPISLSATPIGKEPCWQIRMKRSLEVTSTVVVRLLEGNVDILDYFLLPASVFRPTNSQLTFREPVQGHLRQYQFADLDGLLGAINRRVTRRIPEGNFPRHPQEEFP